MNSNNSLININDLKKVLSILRKNWWIPILTGSIVFFFSFIYTHKLEDIHQVGLQILLKTNTEYNPGSIVAESFGGTFYNNNSYVDNSNEMRVIRSHDLIRKAISRLNFNVSYYIVGRLKTTEQFEGIPFAVTYSTINSSLYDQMIKFRFLDEKNYRITLMNGEEELTRDGKFGKDLIDNLFNIRIQKTQSVNSKTIENFKSIEYVFQIHREDLLIGHFQSSLEIVNPDYTNILVLSINDVIPERGKLFLDTLAQVYIENTLKSKLDLNSNTLLYIERQMGDVVTALDTIEDTMQFYREENNILDLSREGEDYFQKLSTYDAQKTSLGLLVDALNDLERYIIEDKDPAFLPPSVYINSSDDFLKKSTNELYGLQILRNDALSSATENSTGIKLLDQKINRLKSTLLTYISNSRNATKEKIEDVKDEIERYIGNIKTLPNKSRGLVNIQRKLNVNENLYNFLLQRRANTIIAKAGIIPATTVIESSRPTGLVLPNKDKIRYTFLLSGLVLGFVIVIIRVLMFTKIENVGELKSSTSLPIIGEIVQYPNIQEDLKIAVETEPKSPIAESFRTVRTNIQYVPVEGNCKTILITSNSPGEGKTFCTLNLAAILARAEKKVLMLEFDLHKPRIQKHLAMEADIGISTIVIGKSSIESAIKKTDFENLDVILSGPLPPNPSEMVLSNRTKEIFEHAKKYYDYIIIDTPPLGLISDALILMKYADIKLFVLNTRVAFPEVVRNTNELVASNEISNFFFLMNGVKRKRSKYYYSRYGYGYGYGGYGYGGYEGSYTKKS